MNRFLMCSLALAAAVCFSAGIVMPSAAEEAAPDGPLTKTVVVSTVAVGLCGAKLNQATYGQAIVAASVEQDRRLSEALDYMSTKAAFVENHISPAKVAAFCEQAAPVYRLLTLPPSGVD